MNQLLASVIGRREMDALLDLNEWSDFGDLRLMLEDRFPRIWVPSWENRDLRQLLWHRHRMYHLAEAASGGRAGRFQLEAAIQSGHVRPRMLSIRRSAWPRIRR